MNVEELYPYEFMADTVSDDDYRLIDTILEGTGYWKLLNVAPRPLLIIRGNDANLLLKAVEEVFQISGSISDEEWEKIKENPEDYFKEN